MSEGFIVEGIMGTPSYHLYIDDSGTRLPDKEPSLERRDGLDHFALGGVLVASEDVDGIEQAHADLCKKFDIDYPLHSSSIRSTKENFAWMENKPEKADQFVSDCVKFLCSSPIIGHACVVHRPGYNERYERLYGKQRWDLCKSAYTIVVERAVKFARQHERKLVVYVEETGKKEDKAIREYHAYMREEGMFFNPKTSGDYAPLTQAEFTEATLKNPKFTTKKNVLTQVADLVLYPLVKGGYDQDYRTYQDFLKSKLIIDQHLPEEISSEAGVKYYCFDF